MSKLEVMAAGLSAGEGIVGQCWDAEGLAEPISGRNCYEAETGPLDWRPVVEPGTAVTAMLLDAQKTSDHDWCEPVAPSPLYGPLKRVLDVVGGLAGLLLLCPLILVVALLMKLTDGGPVLYRHKRVGRRGQEFTCYKFRTMIPDAHKMKSEILHRNHHDDDRTFKLQCDPRVTRFGKFLRRTSIDELPQLWNVVKGDMSLVGPRPPIPEEVKEYTLADKRRLRVKPGLTCIWQVSGRSELSFPVQMRLDVHYIKHRNLWLDLKLIFLTFPAVLSRRGAY